MIAFFVIALYTLKLLGEGVPPFIVIMSLLFERFCAIQRAVMDSMSQDDSIEAKTIHHCNKEEGK